MSSPIILSRCAGRLAAVLAVGALAAALAGCGGTENAVDPDELESQMLSLAQETADVESASCPDDVSSDVGTEFECTVTNADGEEVPVVSTIITEDDEGVQFEVETIDGVDITP